ncbi:hypothetical protein NQ314_010034 [Rhamnusium bicolor]|uniref:Uncharacterized protein n=1 Tax=Rhamnusium bicolor TaxID=1586634 RepID=A0AAV8XUN4_9CUCU|nr:hypothetical protein NQ314_010034 [Rhamnusium bicolor]
MAGTKASAQNFQLNYLKVDPDLRERVFPRMRADKISLVAKKDPLICAFGAGYLKTHREKHFLSVTSRKMREVSRLLLEIRKLAPTVKNLFDVLKPQNYDLLVTATKNVAKYDNDMEFFQSPTYAMNISTSLKRCCDIAILHALKKTGVYASVSTAEVEAELKTLSHLISNNWKFDVSSQASTDLQTNKWNKITMVPLASDLKLMKDYLIKKATEAIEILKKESTNQNAYVMLLETIFCRLVLLNRKRPGELQRFLLHTYENSLKTENPNTYEEFSEVVTEAEKALMKNFKRIVIRGKRNRGVPVLFSRDIQEHLNILLQHRLQIMTQSNIYLFGNPRTNEPIVGYKVIKKYALNCGATSPNAITCTRLRKHLATLTQLINLSESDMEQLASFMGHTLGIHRSSYRLPDDVFQTAKISKLLLLMEKGGAGKFKGKTLDEIDLNMDEDLMETSEEDNVENMMKEIDGTEGDEIRNVTEQDTLSSETPHTSSENVPVNFKKRQEKNFDTVDRRTKENRNYFL